MRRLNLAIALAAMLGSGKGGDAVLADMFTPRFNVGNSPPDGYRGKFKHPRGGRGSPRLNFTSPWLHNRTENRKTAREQRNLARKPGAFGVDYHAQRMTWLERNHQVIAKREADQARAMSRTGGRNAVMWGRP